MQKPWSPSPLKACHWSLHPFASTRTDLCDHTCVVQVFYWTDMSYCRTCSGAYVLHQMQHWYPAQTETAVGKQPMPWGAVDPAKLTKIQPREQLTETTVGKQPTPWGAVDPAKLTQIQPREHFLSSSCTIDMIWSTLPVDNSAKIQGPASSDDYNNLTLLQITSSSKYADVVYLRHPAYLDWCWSKLNKIHKELSSKYYLSFF